MLERMTRWKLVRCACELGGSRAAAVHVRAGRVRIVLSKALGWQGLRVAQGTGAPVLQDAGEQRV